MTKFISYLITNGHSESIKIEDLQYRLIDWFKKNDDDGASIIIILSELLVYENRLITHLDVATIYMAHVVMKARSISSSSSSSSSSFVIIIEWY
jgi:hypothetical protein